MTPQEEDSILMKALCGLLFLLAVGVLALVVMAQSPATTYEGRPVYDCTQPVSPDVAALARLPIGEVGHAPARRSTRRPSLRVRRKRK